MRKNLLKPALSLEHPSPGTLCARAEGLVSTIRDRSLECNRNRKVPEETIADFRRAGFFKILQPKKFGGYEYSPKVAFDVARILARGCPASAWCLSVLGVHTWEASLMAPEVAEDVWGCNSDALISSSYAPTGTATRVPGGYQLNGRWRFSSGCDHCEWALVGALVTDESTEQKTLTVMFVPRASYEIDHDSWHMMGMQGTGSKDLVINDAFIPEYRTHPHGTSADLYQKSQIRGRTNLPDTYKYPFRIMLSYALSSVVFGMAQGAVDHFIQSIKLRSGKPGTAASGPGAFVQRRVAEAFSLIDGASLRMERDWRDMGEAISEGTEISVERRVGYAWNSVCIAHQAARAIDLLFHSSGANVGDEANPMQRFFRDASLIINHVGLDADQKGSDFGYVLLGKDPSEIGWPSLQQAEVASVKS